MTSTEAKVILVDLKGQQAKRTFEIRSRADFIALSPDASRIAINYLDMHSSPVTILDCSSGDAILEFDRDAFGKLEWHPDGQRLAITTWRTVELWDVDANVLQWASSDLQQVVGGFSISPDGQWLLANYWDGKSRLWDLNARNEALRLDQSVIANWNPASDILGWRNTTSAIEWVHFERSPILKTLPTSQNIDELPYNGAFSSDGKVAIASAGNTSGYHYQRKLDFIDLQSRRRIGRFERDFLFAFKLSEDRRLLSVVHGREWSLFPLQTGATTRESVYGPPNSYSLPGTPGVADISADGLTCAIIQGGRLMAYRVEAGTSSETKPTLKTIVDLPIQYGHDFLRISPMAIGQQLDFGILQ